MALALRLPTGPPRAGNAALPGPLRRCGPQIKPGRPGWQRGTPGRLDFSPWPPPPRPVSSHPALPELSPNPQGRQGPLERPLWCPERAKPSILLVARPGTWVCAIAVPISAPLPKSCGSVSYPSSSPLLSILAPHATHLCIPPVLGFSHRFTCPSTCPLYCLETPESAGAAGQTGRVGDQMLPRNSSPLEFLAASQSSLTRKLLLIPQNPGQTSPLFETFSNIPCSSTLLCLAQWEPETSNPAATGIPATTPC